MTYRNDFNRRIFGDCDSIHSVGQCIQLKYTLKLSLIKAYNWNFLKNYCNLFSIMPAMFRLYVHRRVLYLLIYMCVMCTSSNTQRFIIRRTQQKWS